MAYSSKLADRTREYLSGIQELKIEEKEMFGGLAFLINGKMCINVGEDRLMCRFDPELTDEIAEKTGFLPMIMKGRAYKGYCYVEPVGYKSKKDFEFWITLCLDYNHKAKSSKTKRKK
ncbi:MAG: TfoX/Sxy family protein [Chitinophagaceae bacterium]|nr:TfoX/Sxy family protein [Chitinophagaceae bacterium]